MLDNCGVWLNLAIGLVHLTTDTESKGYVCAHTGTRVNAHTGTHVNAYAWKGDRSSCKVKKVQNLRLVWELRNYYFLFICKVKGTKEGIDCQLLERFLYLNFSTIAIYSNLHTCIVIHVCYSKTKYVSNNGWNYKNSTISVSLCLE